ncbi:MAG: hypothetical protein ACNS60_07385 [Candidatus Cyclobacteriaceae bacterium M2_1C_046]
MEKYIIGILGIAALMAGWIQVQVMWKSVFADQVEDEDVLAGRKGCGNCGCSSTSCSKKKENI